MPLVFVGSYFGYKSPVLEDPVRTNKIPRQIPEQPWYMNPVFSILIGGILPFGAVFIELFFILTSMWLHQFYYLFGFLCLVFVILVITCAEITIVLCYFQLCSEDYRWWCVPILCCCFFAGRVASFKATSGHQAAVRCAFATSDLSRSPSGHRVLQAHSKHACSASLVSSCYLCRACWALHCSHIHKCCLVQCHWYTYGTQNVM